MSPLRLLLFVLFTSLRNWAKHQFARVKTPRYAIALAVGVAYFGYIAFIGAGGAERGEAFRIGAAVLGAVAPFLIAVLAVWWWLWGGYESALAFTPAEVHFLFPAPLTRKNLIQFKLLRSQFMVAFGAILFGLLFSSGPLPWPARIIAFWVMLTALHFHQVASSLVRASAAQQGISGLRRSAVPLTIAMLAGVGLLWTVSVGLPQIRAAEDLTTMLTAVQDVLRQPVPRVVLLPFQLILAPLFAGDLLTWARALPGALIVIALHYVWVIRSDAAFEEAGAEAGVRRAQRIAAIRAGKRLTLSRAKTRSAWRAHFRLRPTGAPVVAFVWKNILAFAGEIRLVTALILLGGLGAVYATFSVLIGSWAKGADAMALITVVLASSLVVFGPLAVRNDLRQDLEKLELLRTYPVGGPSLVAAEIAASTLTLTAVQFALLAGGLLFVPFGSAAPADLARIPVVVGAAALMFPAVNALMLSIQNALALLFPAWVKMGAARPGGIEHMGQTILTALGSLILFTIAMFVPLLIAVATGIAMSPTIGMWAALPAAGVAGVCIGVEVLLLILWLGRVYDDLDPVGAGLVR